MAFIPITARSDIQNNKKGKIAPKHMALLNSYSLLYDTGIIDSSCSVNKNEIVDGKRKITFSSGYLVIYGRLIEVEEDTIVTGNVYDDYSVVLTFNYSSNVIAVTDKIVDNTTYSFVKNDLNELPNSTFDFVLYSNNQFFYNDISKNRLEFQTAYNKIKRIETISPLRDYDNTKGTIENRFAKLGV